MPGSFPTFKKEVARHVTAMCGNTLRIVDVGAGAGVWADLLGHGRLDAVEVWAPYLNEFALSAKYRAVLLADATLIDLTPWEYLIAGDLIEHLPIEDAQALITRADRAGQRLLVAVPYRCEQDAVGGNPYERHLQADLTPDIMAMRYPELRLLIGDETYGYYVNYETAPLIPDPPRVPVVWFFGERGYWDHGLLIHAMDGMLWPTPRPFLYEHHERHEQIGAAGCVGILAGRWRTEFQQPLAEFVAQRSWSLIVNASDEECVGPWPSAMASNSLVWVQTPHVERCGQPPLVRRLIPMGWRTDTRSTAMSPPLAMSPPQRQHLWGFAGQGENNAARRACVETLRSMPEEGWLTVTDTFGAGLPYREYLERMAETALIPCPSGSHTPDTFRLWEALELGCLPVADAQSPVHRFPSDYWSYVFQCAPEDIPFPRLDSWGEFPALLEGYRTDPARLSREMSRAFAWWQGRKRQFVLDLEEDIKAVSGLQPPLAAGLRSQVTVLISTSPVSSHPSTAMIEDTIVRIRAYPELAECEILIMLDGVPEDAANLAEDYEAYTRRLLWLCNWDARFRGCLPLVFERHFHQAEMARRTIPRVRTPLIFFVEHDTYPQGEIDFSGIARVLLESDFANAIRLHLFHEVLREHRHLYTDGMVHEVAGVPLIRTTDWSQRPHLARTDYYRTMIAEHVPPSTNIWIEHALYGAVAASHWEQYRTCIYAPPGDMTRSGHTDGRHWVAP